MNQSQIIGIGMMLIFIGMFVIILGNFFGAKEGKTDVKSAGIIFIGPFPIIGWGSSKKMYYILMILGLVLFFFMMFFLRNLK